MTSEVLKGPYDLTVRWAYSIPDARFVITGAHVTWQRVMIEDGKPVGDPIAGGAERVGIDQTPGYPLDDIINQTLQDALATTNISNAERDDALKRLAEAEELVAKLTEAAANQERQHAIALAAAFKEQPGGPAAALSALFEQA